MKKIYLLFVSMLVTMASTTQLNAQAIYQLPNGGFENWSGNNTSVPAGWHTFSEAQCDLSGIEFLGCSAAKKNHHTREVGRSGIGYSLRIYSTETLNKVANGNFTTGQIRIRTSEVLSAENYNRLVITDPSKYQQITGTPDSLVFWTRFNPKNNGNEDARMCAVIFGKNGGKDGYNGTDPHYGKAAIDFPKTNNQWVQHSTPFVYDENSTNKERNANGHFYLLLSMTTNKTPGKEVKDDEAFFDDIEFVYSAWLSDIKLDGVTLPGFYNGKLTNRVILDESVVDFPSVSYTTEVSDVSQVTNNNVLSPQNDMEGAYTAITVIAEDQVTIKEYRINYTYGSSDNTLSSILIDGTPIAEFSADVESYSVITCQQPPVVSAVANSEFATISIEQAPANNAAAIITVTAEKGQVKTYRVQFTPASDASLLSIKLDNVELTDFDPATFSYNVTLDAETINFPVLTYQATQSCAVVDASLNIPGTSTLTVTAVNGGEAVYTIDIAKTVSDNNLLSELKVDGVAIEGFDAATQTYSYNVVSCSGVPVVSATKASAYASVVVNQASDIKSAATIVVTAEDGSVKTYTVQMVPSSDASLSSILLDNVELTDFDPATLSYNVILDAETINFPALTYQASQSCAVVDPSIAIPGTSTLAVTAADGTKKTYTIIVAKTASANNLLSELKVDGVAIEGFDAATQTYSYNVVSCTDVPVVSATKASTYASIAVNQASDAKSAATIVVTAEDGSTKTYTVQMVAVNTNALLSDIKVDGATVANFDPETLSYNIVFAEDYTGTPVVEYTADCGLSTVVISAINCPGVTTIDVTAADGTTVNRYELSFSILTDIHSSSVANVTLYPNPVKDYMIVEIPTSEESVINIFDQAGRKVYNARHNGSQIRINTSAFNAGLYILEVNGQKIKFNK